MLVKVQRVSIMSDNKQFCLPNYDSKPIEVELDHYTKILELNDVLPKSDEKWPKGDAHPCFVLFDNKIFEKNVI
ncbi:hypothetical protein [Photobacterium kishitanii]|uniref:hypothetical protein n=1 Tax=Photobacterium kishitanii TaxID=318456 RepID=UPI00071AEE40|nr:hypothetical protein [Photobacterium kishitanii]